MKKILIKESANKKLGCSKGKLKEIKISIAT